LDEQPDVLQVVERAGIVLWKFVESGVRIKRETDQRGEVRSCDELNSLFDEEREEAAILVVVVERLTGRPVPSFRCDAMVVVLPA